MYTNFSKHTMRATFPMLLMAAFFAACSGDFFEQTIDLDEPAYERQLVTYTSIGQHDTMWQLGLSRNHGILQSVPDSAWYVKNAKLEILQGGQPLLSAAPLASNANIYQASIPPGLFQPGQTYEFRASHPDFTTASAFQTMPGPFQVDSVRYRQNGGIDSDGTELSSIDVFLKDAAGEENYYAIEVFTVTIYVYQVFDPATGQLVNDTSYYENRLFPYTVEDPNAQLTYSAVLVNDQFFKGLPYKAAFKFYRYNGNINTYFKVLVRSVTRDYYQLWLTEYARANADDNPLAEPVSVYSNLENGIGVFSLFYEFEFFVQ